MNKYFPAGQENIDDLPEEESMMTDQALMDSLTDYADEFGDQKLLDMMRKWVKDKMKLDYALASGDDLQLLSNLVYKMSKLGKNKECIDYQMAVTDCMMVLLEELKNL